MFASEETEFPWLGPSSPAAGGSNLPENQKQWKRIWLSGEESAGEPYTLLYDLSAVYQGCLYQYQSLL